MPKLTLEHTENHDTGHDDIITKDMIVKLAEEWPEAKKTFLNYIRQHNEKPFDLPLLRDVVSRYEKIRNVSILYKGHAFIPKVIKTFESRPIYDKHARFMLYVLQQWNLPHTPDDWLPPDLR